MSKDGHRREKRKKVATGGGKTVREIVKENSSTSSQASNHSKSSATSSEKFIYNPEESNVDVFEHANKLPASNLASQQTVKSTDYVATKTSPMSAAVSSTFGHSQVIPVTRKSQVKSSKYEPSDRVLIGSEVESSNSDDRQKLSDISPSITSTLQKGQSAVSTLGDSRYLVSNVFGGLSNVFGAGESSNSSYSSAMSGIGSKTISKAASKSSTPLTSSHSLSLALKTAKTTLQKPVPVLSEKTVKHTKDKDKHARK